MNVASAARLKLIRQETGLEDPEPAIAAEPARQIPTLRQYQEIFDAWVGTAKEEQKGTVKFYRENYRKLLAYGLWADLPLDRIDEPKIEAFKTWALKHGGRRRNGNRATLAGHWDRGCSKPRSAICGRGSRPIRMLGSTDCATRS